MCKGFERTVVGGGDAADIFLQKMAQHGYGQRTAFVGIGAGAHFIDEDQIILLRQFHHLPQICRMRAEG